MGWNSVGGALGINQQQNNRAVSPLINIDHSRPALLAVAFATPAYFTATARLGNHITGDRMLRQKCGKFAAFFFGLIFRPELAEQWGFNDSVHSVLEYVNDVFCSMPWAMSWKERMDTRRPRPLERMRNDSNRQASHRCDSAWSRAPGGLLMPSPPSFSSTCCILKPVVALYEREMFMAGPDGSCRRFNIQRPCGANSGQASHIRSDIFAFHHHQLHDIAG